MSDEELAKYLHLAPEEAAIVIPKLSPEKRDVYERMAVLETDVFLWENGLGPKPSYALLDYPQKGLMP